MARVKFCESFPTTLAHLLCIEHMQSSTLKQIYSEPMHLSQEPCDLLTYTCIHWNSFPSRFGRFRGSTRLGPFKWPVLLGTNLQSPARSLEHTRESQLAITSNRSTNPKFINPSSQLRQMIQKANVLQLNLKTKGYKRSLQCCSHIFPS